MYTSLFLQIFRSFWPERHRNVAFACSSQIDATEGTAYKNAKNLMLPPGQSSKSSYEAAGRPVRVFSRVKIVYLRKSVEAGSCFQARIRAPRRASVCGQEIFNGAGVLYLCLWIWLRGKVVFEDAVVRQVERRARIK